MNPTALRIAAPRLLTVRNKPALRNHVLDRIDEGARDLVIDLRHTTYVDSSGLALLSDLHRVLVGDLGGRLRVSGPSPELRLLLEVTRLHERLEVVPSVAGYEVTDDAWRAPDDWTSPALA